MMRRISIAGLGVLFAALLIVRGAHALTNEETLSRMPHQCIERAKIMLAEEVNMYREAQYGMDAPSVLRTAPANTTDLVPYLVENYHALSCRLRLVCDAVAESQGFRGSGGLLVNQPLGCSRLLAARGRWWSKGLRDQTFRTGAFPVDECAYTQYDSESYDIPPSPKLTESECDEQAAKILAEESQMLRLITARDAAERGVRRVMPVFRKVLIGVRENFLLPLRDLVGLVGSVLHPIPCLLSQCN